MQRLFPTEFGPIAKAIFRILANKYVICLLIFGIWVVFFDATSLVDIIAARHRVQDLHAKREMFQKRILHDQQRLNELRTNDESLERFAREQYYMRDSMEDLYVVQRDE